MAGVFSSFDFEDEDGDRPGSLPRHIGEEPITHLFRCADCRSFLVLSTWPDGTFYGTATRIGPACPACTAVSAGLLTEVIADVTRRGDAEEVPSPEPVPPHVELRVAPDTAGSVNFTRDLLNEGLHAAIAAAIASWAADRARNYMDRVPATEASTVISAIAKGIESTHQHISRGIAWIVTGITGMPEFPAQVLGSLITSATVPSFDVLTQGLRMFGAVCSVYDGTLHQCACMRDLAATYVFDQPVREITTDILDTFGPLPEPPEPDDPPGPGDLPPPSGPSML